MTFGLTIAVSSGGNEVYVSNWMSSSLSIVNAVTMQEMTRTPLWAPAEEDTPFG